MAGTSVSASLITYRPEFCGDEQSHERHEWIDGVTRRDCPGICTVCGQPFKVCDDCGPRPEGEW